MTHKASNYESLAPCHLLICEDQADNLLLIETLAASFGCSYTAARNGTEAINHCQENKFDVILMDLSMPVVSGLEAAKDIRTNPCKNQQTPIIAVTAEVSSMVASASISFGINDYILKPIDSSLLYQSIKKAIARATSSDSD